MIDLKTIDEYLAKAKEDLAFWEKARAVFLDPRIARVSEPNQIRALPPPVPVPLATRPYGEVKRKVHHALPECGQAPLSTSQIVDKLIANGYAFASKTPAISVNEALVTLEVAGDAYVAEKVGNMRFWTKGEPK